MLSLPTVTYSPNLDIELRLGQGGLLLELRATRDLTVTEVQGPRELLDLFEAQKPEEFVTRWFADDVEVPAEMMEEVAFMNRTDFRWGCDIPMKRSTSTIVPIQAKKMPSGPLPLGIITVNYEYKRLFGLFVRSYSATCSVGSANGTEDVDA